MNRILIALLAFAAFAALPGASAGPIASITEECTAPPTDELDMICNEADAATSACEPLSLGCVDPCLEDRSCGSGVPDFVLETAGAVVGFGSGAVNFAVNTVPTTSELDEDLNNELDDDLWVAASAVDDRLRGVTNCIAFQPTDECLPVDVGGAVTMATTAVSSAPQAVMDDADCLPEDCETPPSTSNTASWLMETGAAFRAFIEGMF